MSIQSYFSFLKKGGGGRLIGLDLGSYWVKALELNLTKTGREIKGLAKKELPPEMRQGERDPRALSKLIKECLSEGGISARDVVIMVSGPQVFIRRITMPPMPEEDLAEVIPFEATKHVSFPVDQLTVDYIIVGEKEVEGIKNLDILLVAIPREIVESEIAVVRAAGLRPVAVTVAPMVLWKAFQLSGQEAEAKVIAMLDIGHERTTISLLNNGLLEFMRTINVSGDEFTKSLMTIPVVREGEGGRALTYEEAETIKLEHGFPPPSETGTTGDGVALNQISMLMGPVLEKLLGEVRTSFDFYVTEFQVPGVDKIVLSGGSASLKGLKEYLFGDLGIEVALADPFQGVDFAKEMSEDDVTDLAPAFVMPMGLAAWNKGDLSLFRKKKVAKKDLGLIKALGVPPGVAALIVICLYFYLSSKLADVKAELDKKTQEFASLSPMSTAAMALSGKRRKLKAEIYYLPQALSESVDSAGILEEIRRAIPDNTRLEQIYVVPQPGKKLIRIYGTAFFLGEKGPSMSDFMAALKESPLFNDVRMLSLEEDKNYTVNGLRFQLSCQYNPLVP